MAALFRRYAQWLVSITWKRFIVLSLLLIIMAAILGEIPPFSWPIAETTTRGARVSVESNDAEVNIGDHGVVIRRKREAAPDTAKPQSLRQEIAQELRDEITR